MLRAEGDGAIRETLATYSPGSTRGAQSTGYTRVCLQLFGMSGHGKSSLINSCLCVVKNDAFSNIARAANSSETTTRTRKEYKLTNAVYITDNMGLNKIEEEEVLELSAQLRNLRVVTSENEEEKLGAESEVKWELGVKKTLNYLEDLISKNYTDFLVPVLVYSSESTIIQKDKEHFRSIIDSAHRITGLHPIIVLTRYKDKHIASIEKHFTDLGCPHIIALENYTPQNQGRNPETDKRVLDFIKVCLQEADRQIECKHNADLRRDMMRKIGAQIASEEKIMKAKLEHLKRERDSLKIELEKLQEDNKKSNCVII